MDFKCFNMNPHHRSSIATLSVLVCTLIYQKMYLSFIILIPLLLILWIYIILLVRNSFVTNTSIEVNIIDHKEILNTINRSKNFTDSSINGVSKKKIRYHVPKFMLELYEKNKSRDKSASKEPDLVRSLIPTQTEKLQDNDILEELSENHLLIFDIPDSNQDERFIGAELKILTQVEINSKNELGVKKILKISTYDETTRKYCFLREIDYHHFNNTWLSFDLTKEVDTLLQKNTDKKFLKIVITISSYFRQSENNLKLSLLPVVDTFSHDYPILLLSYSIEEETFERQNKISNEKRTNVIRKRRSIDEDYEEETNMIWNGDIPKKNLLKKYKRNNCRRRPLYIEFSEIEYDLWIVQPSGYEAYQCQGKCFYPVADHLSPTKHAIMQALIHSVNPSKASRSCCVPTVLDSISILYVDDKGVLTYRYAYKDMVVLECGCR